MSRGVAKSAAMKKRSLAVGFILKIERARGAKRSERVTK